MDFATLVRSSRTVRRFKESEAVDAATLEWLVDLARFCPSGGNFQPLKFVVANEAAMRERIFGTLAWAAYLKEWPGPVPGERPAAYVVVLHDTRVSEKVDCDHGIMAQTIMLGAASRGLGGCILASVDKKALAGILELPAHFTIMLVLALGKPAETVTVEDTAEATDRAAIRYWRDDAQGHHVPKRTLETLIAARYFDHG
jgi:nitroreductase